MASVQPAARGKRTVDPPSGGMPRSTSRWAKRVPRAATAMSALSISSIPAVQQVPCTATTSGLLRRGWTTPQGSTPPSG